MLLFIGSRSWLKFSNNLIVPNGFPVMILIPKVSYSRLCSSKGKASRHCFEKDNVRTVALKTKSKLRE